MIKIVSSQIVTVSSQMTQTIAGKLKISPTALWIIFKYKVQLLIKIMPLTKTLK